MYLTYFDLIIVCNRLLQLNNIEQLTYGFVTSNSSISRVFILTVIVVCLGNSLYFVMCKFIKLINVYKFNMMIKCKKKEKKDTEEYMKEGKQKDKFNKDILFYLIDRDYKKYTEWEKMYPRKNKY